jgi:hypothetical protein
MEKLLVDEVLELSVVHIVVATILKGICVETGHAIIEQGVIQHSGIVVVVHLAGADTLIFAILIDEDHENVRDTGDGDLRGVKHDFSEAFHLLANEANFFAYQA